MNAEGFFPQNTSSNIIMVTATDRFARRNEYRSDDKIEAEVMDVLREMYGDDIPDPLDMIVPRWTLDPFYRGSYSNWPLGASVEHHRNLGQPVSANGNWLHFTGEAMSEDKFGYVQGAWEEGIKTAGIVAQCLRGTCPIPPVDEAISKLSKGKVRPVRRHAIPKRGRK
jgi:polyamine oxidase